MGPPRVNIYGFDCSCSQWEERVPGLAVHSLHKRGKPASALAKTSKLCWLQWCKLTRPETRWLIPLQNICFCDCLGFLFQVNFANDEILTFISERREWHWGSWWSYGSTLWRAGQGLGRMNWSTYASWGPAAAVLCIRTIQEVLCLVFRCYASKTPGSSGEIKLSKTVNLDN